MSGGPSLAGIRRASYLHARTEWLLVKLIKKYSRNYAASTSVGKHGNVFQEHQFLYTLVGCGSDPSYWDLFSSFPLKRLIWILPIERNIDINPLHCFMLQYCRILRMGSPLSIYDEPVRLVSCNPVETNNMPTEEN